ARLRPDPGGGQVGRHLNGELALTGRFRGALGSDGPGALPDAIGRALLVHVDPAAERQPPGWIVHVLAADRAAPGWRGRFYPFGPRDARQDAEGRDHASRFVVGDEPVLLHAGRIRVGANAEVA